MPKFSLFHLPEEEGAVVLAGRQTPAGSRSGAKIHPGDPAAQRHRSEVVLGLKLRPPLMCISALRSPLSSACGRAVPGTHWVKYSQMLYMLSHPIQV